MFDTSFMLITLDIWIYVENIYIYHIPIMFMIYVHKHRYISVCMFFTVDKAYNIFKDNRSRNFENLGSNY